MASESPSPFHDQTEHCEECGRDTRHEVGVEICIENAHENAVFSREPYRVARCVTCGNETVQRMNNA